VKKLHGPLHPFTHVHLMSNPPSSRIHQLILLLFWVDRRGIHHQSVSSNLAFTTGTAGLFELCLKAKPRISVILSNNLLYSSCCVRRLLWSRILPARFIEDSVASTSPAVPFFAPPLPSHHYGMRSVSLHSSHPPPHP